MHRFETYPFYILLSNLYIQLSCIYIILDYLFLASAFFQKNNFIFLQIPCLFLKSQTERFFSCFFIAILQREKTKRSMKNVF
ncbi:hypothetical protein FKZ12_12720 [Enterococcus faecalis]|nr:hypothetical protein FKZ12_12720 [Enterococcus faecalis]